MAVTYIRRTEPLLFQGDILQDTVYYYLPPGFLILREGDDGYLEATRIEDTPSAFDQREIITAHAERGRVIILSHSCDAQHKDIIQIAPVSRISLLREELWEPCRQNRTFNYFYLPADPRSGLEESFVNFQLMVSYNLALLSAAKRIVSLSDDSVGDLGECLLFYFTRKKLVKPVSDLPFDKS